MPMEYLAERLAAQAFVPVHAEEADTLRTLTLTNVAAGLGELGSVEGLLASLPLDPALRPADAAFLFAARLHARTQDDFYPDGRVHVGAVTLAVTLALADYVGDRTLECLAAGYRVFCTVARAHSVEAQRRGMRPSGVFGPFGAAASSAVALGLDAAATANAIALAAAVSAGHNQAWIAGSDEWMIEVANAARAGVEAALFTQAGVRAAPDAFEGRSGWASALFDERGAATLAATMAIGITDARDVAIKPYPVSGIAQVPTWLACMLHGDNGGLPEQILVTVSPIEHAYPGSSNRGPFASRSSALMSIAFCVACGLADGAVRLSRLDAPPDTRLADLLERVRVEPDAEMPEHAARIQVLNGSGKSASRSGAAAQVLFPDWHEVSERADEVARRSEADTALVAAAATELARPRPRARELRQLLEERRA
jgi:2-methylcitrate dehydratase PrpD